MFVVYAIFQGDKLWYSEYDEDFVPNRKYAKEFTEFEAKSFCAKFKNVYFEDYGYEPA